LPRREASCVSANHDRDQLLCILAALDGHFAAGRLGTMACKKREPT
jgi:hypothetical protein